MLDLIETGKPVLKDQVMQDIVAKRYFQPGETSWSDLSRRIAKHVASAEPLFFAPEDRLHREVLYRQKEIEEQFYDALNSQHVVASSPIIFNAGTPCKMLSACTGVVFADDSIPAILKAVTECATLTADGAGVGYNITPLRYRDAPLSRKGVASGACSWLNLMDAVGQTVRQGGRNRRAAMIALLHIDHPDAVEFCFIKDDTSKLTHMNISLQVTDEFMERVNNQWWHRFQFPVGSGTHVVLSVSPKDMDSKDDPRWAVFVDGYNKGFVKAEAIFHPEYETLEELRVSAVRADWLFDLICEHAHRTGEPGLFFIDRHEALNPIQSVSPVGTVNPCGEVMLNTLSGAQLGLPDIDHDGVPVQSHDSCNLAHLVLPRFVKRTMRVNQCDDQDCCGCEEWAFEMDWDKLRRYIGLTTRFLDNVIELSEYRPEKIGRANRAIRKNGLGIIGFADLLIMLGYKYGTSEAEAFAHQLASWIEFWALSASCDLAVERGSFSLYEDSEYHEHGLNFRNFPEARAHPYLTRNMWEGLSERVSKGLRNAMVTMLAPTGSTALIVGNLSNSIEPIFFKEQRRRTVDAVTIVERHWLYEEFKQGNLPSYVTEDLFVQAFDVSPEAHVSMQNVWQRWISNSISKTINLPHTATVADVQNAYLVAFEGGAKGVTVYRDGSRGFQPVSNSEVTMDDKGVLDVHGTVTGRFDAGMHEPNIPKADLANDEAVWQLGVTPAVESAWESGSTTIPVPRPEMVHGRTYKIEFNGEKVYVTINRDPVTNRVLEVFLNHGKAGSDEQAKMEAIGRLISVGLKWGTPIEEIVKQLRGIGGDTQTFYKGRRFSSLPDAVGTLIAEDLGQSKPKTVEDADRFLEAAKEAVRKIGERPQPPNPGLVPPPWATGWPPIDPPMKWVKRVDPSDPPSKVWWGATETITGAIACPECKLNSYVIQSGCGSCQACGYSRC